MFDLNALLVKAESQFAALKGEPVTISRCPLNAVVLDEPPLFTDGTDTHVKEERIAVQFTASDLKKDGRVIFPTQGMEICRTVGTRTLRYAIQPQPGSNQHFVWLGTTR